MTAAPLSLRRLNRATLDRQALLERRSGGPAEVIGQLAGLQAQHANQPYIALWSRMEGMTIDALQGALQERSVVRATVMRATLHLTAADDFATFDSAVAVARFATWASSARKAGIDLERIHEALLDFCEEPRTVAEMEAHLDSVASDRSLEAVVPAGVRHVAFRLASSGGGLVHVPPSGFWGEHGRPRYVAARAWLGERGRPVELDRAYETVVVRYLTAYAPASVADIGKWLGQPRIGLLRAAVERLGDRLQRLEAADGRDLLDVADATLPDEDVVAPPRFLSRWDSVLISYADRERILPPAHRDAVIKKNGDFLPTFLVDGWVAGRWSTSVKRGEAVLQLEPFGRIGAADRRTLEAEGERLLAFIEPEATSRAVSWL
jgi:hypothetical protein